MSDGQVLHVNTILFLEYTSNGQILYKSKDEEDGRAVRSLGIGKLA